MKLKRSGRENRQYPRMAVPAPYSQVQVRRAGRRTYRLSGHVYDISQGGMRFELDQPLDAGEHVGVRVNLPGRPDPIEATGRIVRFVDPEDPGPARMAMCFDRAVDIDPHHAA